LGLRTDGCHKYVALVFRLGSYHQYEAQLDLPFGFDHLAKIAHIPSDPQRNANPSTGFLNKYLLCPKTVPDQKALYQELPRWFDS
jgi:hypothetical protein